MGKPVRFRRGIATVIPDCQKQDGQPDYQPEGVLFTVCESQTLRYQKCYQTIRLSEAHVGVLSH